jgi:hypothetical protein
MDWTKQTEEMFKAWSEAQTRMFETFSESVSGFGKTPGEKLWAQTIAAGEQWIKTSLAAQAEWMKAWGENFAKIEGMPEGATASIQQFQEMTQRWAATQERMWAAWFDLLKKVDPGRATGAWGEAPQNPFSAWQDATKKVMDSQMEWMRAWMGSFEKGEGK